MTKTIESAVDDTNESVPPSETPAVKPRATLTRIEESQANEDAEGPQANNVVSTEATVLPAQTS